MMCQVEIILQDNRGNPCSRWLLICLSPSPNATYLIITILPKSASCSRPRVATARSPSSSSSVAPSSAPSLRSPTGWCNPSASGWSRTCVIPFVGSVFSYCAGNPSVAADSLLLNSIWFKVQNCSILCYYLE